MKQLLILISLLLSFSAYSQVYQLQINDQKKSLSKSIVVQTTSRAFSLLCNEGVLNSVDRTCTVTNQINRVEECPSGYINQGNGTCEASQTVSATQYCASGTDVGYGCRVILYSSRRYGCDSQTYGAQRKIGNYCYDFAGSYYDPVMCTTDYIRDLNSCYLRSTQKPQTYYCNSGYTLSGSTCIREDIDNYSYSCPSGFSLSGSLCTRIMSTTVSLSSCPEGYTEVSSELCEQVLVTPATINCPSGTVYDSGRDACV